MLQRSSGAHQETKRIDSRGFPSFSIFVWLSDGSFFLTSAKCMAVVQQDSRLRCCWEFARSRSTTIDSKDLLPDATIMNHFGDALFRKLIHVAFTEWFVPSSTDSPFNYSKAAKFHEPPVFETGNLNPSLLALSVTVTLRLQLFVFVHDFPLERTFCLCFSLVFFLFFVVHACASCRADKKVILPAAIRNGR